MSFEKTDWVYCPRIMCHHDDHMIPNQLLLDLMEQAMMVTFLWIFRKQIKRFIIFIKYFIQNSENLLFETSIFKQLFHIKSWTFFDFPKPQDL